MAVLMVVKWVVWTVALMVGQTVDMKAGLMAELWAE